MSRWMEPTEDDVRKWEEYLGQHTVEQARMLGRYPPWELFRLKGTSHRVTVVGFHKACSSHGDGLIVWISGRFNAIVMERLVQHVSPSDLEPCELPAPDEKLGTLLPDPLPEELAVIGALGPLGLDIVMEAREKAAAREATVAAERSKTAN